MNKILWAMGKIKHTSMKICDEQNIYIRQKEKNKQKGEIKDILA